MTDSIHCHACGTDGLTRETFMAHARTCELHPMARELRRVGAEVSSLRNQLHRAHEERDEAREALLLVRALAEDTGKLVQAAMVDVATMQREACAKEAAGLFPCGYGMDADEAGMRDSCVEAVRETPLVVEVKP